MKKTAWFNRHFPVIEDNGLLPVIIERLAGAPVRLQELLADVPEEVLTRKPDDKWSAKEHAGHLADLEPLWYSRLEDLLEGKPELTVADLTNQRTHNANHNASTVAELIAAFKTWRAKFVTRLWQVEESSLEHTALHPRLRTPMRIIDLVYFVAEHDDHHLSAIREMIVQA
ncbi:MAG: DinB family protein [Filimonas sp.]|nr:DinB family protein [Filimonas sp.]